MTRDAFATLRSAVGNASQRAVGDDEIRDVLRTGTGAGHVVLAVFGDCAIDTLVQAASLDDMSYADLLAAYRTARSRHAAVNEELETMVAEADARVRPASVP